MWNVMSLYRADSLTVTRILVKYKLQLFGVEESRWDGSDTESAGDYTFCYLNGNENHELETGSFV
jgi:hypothetical protein